MQRTSAWARVMTEEEIYLAARQIESAAARREYLQRVCPGDPALLHRIEQRLEFPGGMGYLLDDGGDVDSDADTATIGLKTAAHTCLPGPTTESPIAAPRSMAPPVSPFAAGQLLARRYRIVAPVGRGGMGWVLRARDEQQNRDVALKLLNPSLVSDRNAAERLRHEAFAAASVTHSRFIVIEAVEESDGIPFLVMEYVNGESLARRLARQTLLPVPEVLRIGYEVAEGLSAAHRSGLIHLDVKPANILLEKRTGQVRISDFGLARTVGELSVTQNGDVVGTPQYMSPEQASGQKVDARCDLFSLGVVLYEMCAGISPFRAETGIATLRRVRDDDPPSLLELRPDIPGELASIVTRLMAKRAVERVPSADELVSALRRLLIAYDRTQFPHLAHTVSAS